MIEMRSMKTPGRNVDFSINVSLWVWCLFGLVFWQVLLWAQSPSILMDDSGEMVAASWNLGLPHPPGYPLFDLVGHVFSWLPVGTVAFRFNLISTLIVLLSLVFLLKTCVVLVARFKSKKNNSDYLVKPLLMVTALAFLSCGTVFSQCLSAKGFVYTLTLLILSVLIWMRVSGLRGKRVTYAAWFLWGLGLANHWQTIILLAPFVIFLTVWESGFTVKNFVFIWFFSILGLSLYLYLPLRAALMAQPFWGFPLHWTEFKWVVFRQLVAGEEMKIHRFGFYGEAFAAMLNAYGVWMPGMMVMAAAGGVVLYRFEKTLFRDFLILFLPIVLALAAVHETNNLFLIPVYLMPLSGLIALLSFAGLFWLLSKGGFAFQKTVVLVLILFSVFWGWNVFELQNKNRFTLAEDFGVNVLKCLPKGAVLLADGDNYVMPLWYAKYVNHQRPDVVLEPTVFLYHEWGWNQLRFQAEDLRQIARSSNGFKERLTQLAENKDHPFFYSLGRQFWPESLNQIHGEWLIQGLVYGWAETRTEKDSAEKIKKIVFQERLRNLEEYREAADPPTRDLYLAYAQQRLLTADWYRSHQNNLSALAQLESVLFFQPESAVTYDNMASLVGSMGYFEMSRSLSQSAIEADPRSGLSYADLARVDAAQRKYLEAREDYEKAMMLGVNHEWVENQLSLLDRQASGKQSVRDKSALEYKKFSEILQKSECDFLSGLAARSYGMTIKSVN